VELALPAEVHLLHHRHHVLELGVAQIAAALDASHVAQQQPLARIVPSIDEPDLARGDLLAKLKKSKSRRKDSDVRVRVADDEAPTIAGLSAEQFGWP
jgi:hypothetical protein